MPPINFLRRLAEFLAQRTVLIEVSGSLICVEPAARPWNVPWGLTTFSPESGGRQSLVMDISLLFSR